jgi:hypothetical protein
MPLNVGVSQEWICMHCSTFHPDEKFHAITNNAKGKRDVLWMLGFVKL